MSQFRQLNIDGVSYSICLPHLDTDYIQGKVAKENQPYELAMLRDMASRLSAGDLVLDVGANIGNHTLYLASVAGCKVEAFEPNKELCAALDQSIRLNRLKDSVHIHQVGVASMSGKAHFKHYDERNLGAQSLETSSDQDDEITLVALDSYNWDLAVKLIKIDVEGMELSVLKGAVGLITRDKPILYIESQSESDFKSISSFLTGLGYIYCKTFNATPTHLFFHESYFKKISEVAEFLNEKASIIYATESENKIIKQKLQEANDKYKWANQNIQGQKDKLDAANQKYRDITIALKTLQEQNEQLNQELRQAQLQKIEAQHALSVFKASVTYKSGLYLRAASGSLVDAVKLPVRLLRLRQQATNQKQKVAPENQVLEHKKKEINSDVIRDLSSLFTKVLREKPNKQIKVASIMDDFTFASYKYECVLHQLTPENWKTELEECHPELLFVESAWRGKDELWGSKVGHCSQELQGIVAWCRERHIPTVFWNKEDPVHFETFLNTARLFDFVFTTDVDCIHRYKAALGHEQVYFLPFACQPAVHNPIEKYQRKDAFCFAGAYYKRYPERTRDLESFVNELSSYRTFEIYDRNYGKDDPNYQFPEVYQSYIVGTLPFEEIDKAYKGYRYAINLNSIKQSQTMFARRIYELLGSNTLTISNFSRGVRLMFGDLVVTSDSGAEIKRRLDFLDDGNRIDRIRLAGLRKVMLEHTYEDRINYVLEKVTGKKRPLSLPAFVVLATASNENEVKSLLANVERQKGVDVSLTLALHHDITHDNAQALLSETSLTVNVLSVAEVHDKSLVDFFDGRSWLCGMVPEDYYGPNYLLDIALATRYSDAAIVGKAAYYTCSKNLEDTGLQLCDADHSFKVVNQLLARRAAINPEVAAEVSADEWLASLQDWQYTHSHQLAIDPFNYCEYVTTVDFSEAEAAVNDLELNSGISLNELNRLAEKVGPVANQIHETPFLDGSEFAKLLAGKTYSWLHEFEYNIQDDQNVPLKLTRNKAIDISLNGTALEIDSTLPDGKHEYLYASKDIAIDYLNELLPKAKLGTIPMHLEIDPGLNLSLVVLFLNAKRKRIGHVVEQPNCNLNINLPENVAFLRLGLRIYASGRSRINRLIVGHLDLDPSNILGQSDVLLLTNHYPSYDDLYRNGFIHARVKEYQERGVPVDIFRLRKDHPISWHEFQDVDIITGSQQTLRRMFQSGRYRHVLVHFLDPDMWEVLKHFINIVNMTVWVHGVEIQPWYRRKFNIETSEQEVHAKVQSEIRMAFWKGLLKPMPANLHLVFVSKTFAKEVMEDYDLQIPVRQYSIVHNPINTELFNFIEKSEEQRKKILSIRPFASRVYANDLTIEAILKLSKKPFFNELEFRIIGDGVLFEEITKPIKNFDNVIIEKKFLTQVEIATLHKEYGVFLCPTRYDTQGVSRDEAMSSGLVPVTNRVAAIPEFVDETCAVLAPAEDAAALAAGIEKLYHEPDRFLFLSENSACRVRRQSSMSLIVARELQLFSPYDSAP